MSLVSNAGYGVGEARYAQAIGECASKSSQVDLALVDLETQIERLGSILSELTVKLSPVLMPESPCCSAEKNCIGDAVVPLAAQITKHSRVVNDLYQHVSELYRRVEL